jgi:hypothetical protein
MKPMDWSQFQKWIHGKGYSIGTSSKHHVILDKQGKIVKQFAVAHKAGGKRYVKPTYIKQIAAIIGAPP